MKVIAVCPCCSTPMLHHFHDHREYWFCRKCWQEMPDLSEVKEKIGYSQNRIVDLSPNLVERTKAIAI